MTGLASGTTYFFTVAAVNEARTGPPSVEVSAEPKAAPSGSGGDGTLDMFCLAVLALLVVGRRLAHVGTVDR